MSDEWPFDGDGEDADDGRHIDSSLARLSGEGGRQVSKRDPGGVRAGSGDGPPVPFVSDESYSSLPLLKGPVWIWTVPLYFYVGGVAGASAVLGAALQWGAPGLRGLLGKCRWTAALGCLSGAVLLIADLGRPERFLNMLRVFRLTSPMSVGSWVLAVMGPLATASAVTTASRYRLLRRAGDCAGWGAGLLGVPLAGYTGVLLATTAIPVWRDAGRSLPWLFIGSGMSGASALLELTSLTSREESVVTTFGTLATSLELVGMAALDWEASRGHPPSRPFRGGPSSTLWSAAKVLAVSALGATLMPTRSRGKRIAVGVLGTAAALCIRFAVVREGRRHRQVRQPQ